MLTADGVGDDDAYVGAEHVHVFPEAEVVVGRGVAVLPLVVKHIGVDSLLAPQHKDDDHMIIIMTCKS